MTTLRPVDAAIMLAFVALTVGLGFWISGRASRNLRSYFLGGNSIPWYLLGVSNASGMFDISGTMLMVAWLFVYGLKSVWIPWLWPVFNQIVLMAYLSVWLRRSGVLTGADWIRLRFGSSPGAQAAHLVVVLFALINVVGFLAYGFIGAGKFAATFLTEVLQFAIMTVACVGVGVLAIWRVSPEMVASVVPAGWERIWFGWEVGLDWSGLLPAAAERIASDGWRLFSLFFTVALLKGLLASMAGPAPNYDMQRVLSARSPREAALMSGVVSLVLLLPRYMLITGLTVLALTLLGDGLAAADGTVDFDLVLPLVMRDLVPAGLFGLLLTALLAAFMSTYAATVNAAPAYVVNDIYKRYLNPHASDATYVRMSYLTTVVVVVVGTSLGFFVDQLQDVVNWIVGSLYGGYVAANVLKWHWWRFNGWGYFWGMITGIAAALACAVILSDQATLGGFEKNLAVFPVILAVSLTGSIAGSLLTRPDDPEVLARFYLRVRPWGWWGPIHARLLADHPRLVANRDWPRDIFNVAVGIVWQTSLTAAGIYLVLQDFTKLGWALGLAVACMAVLKLSWYDRLRDYPDDVAAEMAAAEQRLQAD
jgi:SSS family solute:Na+ symporter